MSSSTDKDAFLAVYKDIEAELIADIQNLPALSDNVKQQLIDYYSVCLPYTVPGGKMTRGLTVIKGVEVLKQRKLTDKEYKDAAILGWQVEWLQAFFLVADDIMDASITRRGSPCWYKKPNVTQDNAINDALILENMIYQTLRRHFKSHPSYVQLLELFIDTTFQTEVGQHIDTNGTPYADGKRAPLDLSRFTLDRYQGCVRYKTCYYSFYLSCALALAYCGYDPDTPTGKALYQNAEDICMILGEYFQIQDDVLDAFAPPEILGKIGTDIEDAKCSWLVCKALELVTDEQKKILMENYGKHDAEGVNKVKALYKELKLEELFHNYEEEQKKICDELIAKIEPVNFQELFKFLLGKIYKRQK
jgi:farnesyl diphosphate synthase